MTVLWIVATCALWTGAGLLWGFVAREAWEQRRAVRLAGADSERMRGEA